MPREHYFNLLRDLRYALVAAAYSGYLFCWPGTAFSEVDSALAIDRSKSVVSASTAAAQGTSSDIGNTAPVTDNATNVIPVKEILERLVKCYPHDSNDYLENGRQPNADDQISALVARCFVANSEALIRYREQLNDRGELSSSGTLREVENQRKWLTGCLEQACPNPQERQRFIVALANCADPHSSKLGTLLLACAYEPIELAQILGNSDEQLLEKEQRFSIAIRSRAGIAMIFHRFNCDWVPRDFSRYVLAAAEQPNDGSKNARMYWAVLCNVIRVYMPHTWQIIDDDTRRTHVDLLLQKLAKRKLTGPVYSESAEPEFWMIELGQAPTRPFAGELALADYFDHLVSLKPAPKDLDLFGAHQNVNTISKWLTQTKTSPEDWHNDLTAIKELYDDLLVDSPYKKELSQRVNVAIKEVSTLEPSPIPDVLKFVKDNLWLILPAIVLIWWGLLWMIGRWQPLYLMRIRRIVGRVPRFQIEFSYFSWLNNALPAIILPAFLWKRTSVVDGWVEAHSPAIRRNLNQSLLSSVHRIYVESPVELNGTDLEEIQAADVRAAWFGTDLLLIHGDGGCGKTSFAIQLARWAISPDKSDWLAKHPIVPAILGKEIEVVKGQLDDLLDLLLKRLRKLSEDEALDVEFLSCLLETRRVVVVVDGFSERGEAVRELIRPWDPTFPIKSLMITSRIEESLGGSTLCSIKPLPVLRNRCVQFTRQYLKLEGAEDVVNNSTILDECGQLADRLEDARISAHLLSIHARQMISAKRLLYATASVVEATIHYCDRDFDLLTQCVTVVDHHPRDDATVSEARERAWKSFRHLVLTTWKDAKVQRTGLPTETQDFWDSYFTNGLNLMRRAESKPGGWQFTLPLLEEYLAASYLAATFENISHESQRRLWRELLGSLKNEFEEQERCVRFLVLLIGCFRLSDDFGDDEKVINELTDRVNRVTKLTGGQKNVTSQQTPAVSDGN